MQPNIINNPPDNWLERLRRGHKVWLVKENREAEVVFAYEPPEPGHYCGQIGIRYGLMDSWFIDINGKGIDGSQLMLPLKNNLPENPEPLPATEIRRLYREIDYLKQRMTRLEQTKEYVLAGIVRDDDNAFLSLLANTNEDDN